MIGKKINQLATELAPVSTDLTIIGNPTTGVSKKITLEQLGAIFSGAVSFYTNLAAFPNPGTINVIYCAKDTKKLYLWSGSAYVEVFPSQALLDTYQLRSEKGVSNGYASLDSGGKVPISQLPSSIMEYKGTWNAATNTPTLANGTGDTGDVYICNVAGTVNFGAGPITFAVGDYVIYSGSIWQRSSGAVGTVTSVGASITGDSITISNSPISTSGTLAFAFAGNSTQYVNGAGNLVTFPGIINEAQNLITEVYNKTGATLTKGTVVYINGGQGNLPTITKALATGDSTSAQTYGIVRNDITNNNNGYVVVAGRISDLDTQAYTEGTQLYLSPTTAGTYTSTKPYAPNHLVYVGIVVRAHPTQGVVEVKIQNGYELDELHNVSAQSPTNNDGIFYNSTTSLWEKKSIATVLGYTPQAQLNGTGFVKASGTTISYDNSTYVTIDTFENITASKNFTVGLSLGAAGGGNQVSVFANTNSIHSGSAGTNIFGFNSSNNIYFGKGSSNGGVIIWNNSTARYYTLPDADGTIALVGGSGVGSVTSVAALTLGTSGTDLSSTVANSTTTPVITLNVPTASATNRGALSSADWASFNSKQNAITLTTTGTSGAATLVGATLNIPNYAPDLSGYVPTSRTITINGTSFDLSANRSYSVGTVTSVGLSSATSGVTIGSTPITTSGTITLAIATASGSQQGLLSSTDWTTFNNKQNTLTNPVTGTGTTNYLPKFTGTSTIGNSLIFDNGTNLGINTTTPTFSTGYTTLSLNGSTGGQIEFKTGDVGKSYIYSNSTDLRFFTSGGAFRFDGGNLGLGVTPSAWVAGISVIDIGARGTVYTGSVSNGSAYNAYVGSLGWQYKQSAEASRYEQNSGTHAWYNAPSGTAGNAITFTQAMTLNASGSLGLGTASPSVASGLGLVLNGQAGQTRLAFKNTYTGDTSGDGVQFALIGGSSGFVFQNRESDGYFSFETNGNEAARINASGNLSIGNTNDTYKLDVSGGSSNVYIRAITSGSANFATLLLENGDGTWHVTNDNTGTFNIGTSNDPSEQQKLTIASTGAATFSSSIKTGAPTNGTAQPWKLGNAVSGGVTTNHYIIVEINGTTYTINALQGLP